MISKAVFVLDRLCVKKNIGLTIKLTGTASLSYRCPVENLCKNLMGKVFADKGYLGKELFEKLMNKGMELITQLRKNMKNAFMPLWDKLMLSK